MVITAWWLTFVALLIGLAIGLGDTDPGGNVMGFGAEWWRQNDGVGDQR